MRTRIARLLGATALAVAAVIFPAGFVATAADGCPSVEVVFARGTAEAPGVGWIGQQFVDALRWRLGLRPMGVYAVNFPAMPEFATTVDGVIDASNHIRDTVALCPGTELVLGGFSRGAALMGYVTAPNIPGDYMPLSSGTGQLPPEVAGHVAAVVLLGKPSTAFLNSIGAPPLVVNPSYAPKTIDLCAAGDPICSDGTDGAAHGAYAANGMTNLAADFTAERL